MKFENSTSLVDALKMSASRDANLAAIAPIVPSVKDLTIQDARWQFLANICPNLQASQ